MQFKSDLSASVICQILRAFLLALCVAGTPFLTQVKAQALEDANTAGLHPVCGIGEPVPDPLSVHLLETAEDLGLRHPRAFAGVVATIQQTGRAPECYLTKRQARLKGWRRGTDLCLIATPAKGGIAIGGTVFENREGLLPERYEGRYRIADLDFDCGRRGAKRLVYVRDAPGTWLFWVTLDHYDSFIALTPPP